MEPYTSVRDALRNYRREHGLDQDSHSSRIWRFWVGPISVRLPNFNWRREAITRHDLHHVLTGYPCTVSGECHIATWEFAAGRFPHPAATLFCLPLVAAGVCWSPRSIWRAFLSGRRSHSLYGIALTEEILRMSILDLADRRISERASSAGWSDYAAFGWLVAQAGFVVLVPIIAIMAVGLTIWGT